MDGFFSLSLSLSTCFLSSCFSLLLPYFLCAPLKSPAAVLMQCYNTMWNIWPRKFVVSGACTKKNRALLWCEWVLWLLVDGDGVGGWACLLWAYTRSRVGTKAISPQRWGEKITRQHAYKYTSKFTNFSFRISNVRQKCLGCKRKSLTLRRFIKSYVIFIVNLFVFFFFLR